MKQVIQSHEKIRIQDSSSKASLQKTDVSYFQQPQSTPELLIQNTKLENYERENQEEKNKVMKWLQYPLVLVAWDASSLSYNTALPKLQTCPIRQKHSP